MSRFSTLLALASLSLFALACGSGSDDPAGGQDAGSSSQPTFAVGVTSAEYRDAIGSQHPGQDDRFLVVTASLENLSNASPLSLDLTRFTAKSRAALVYSAAPATALLDNPCRADVAVARDGKASCALAFSFPKSETPFSLAYATADESQSASIPEPTVVEPPPCLVTEQWMRFTTPDCTSCKTAYCGSEIETIRSSCNAEDQQSLNSCSGGLNSCQCAELVSSVCQTAIGDYLPCLIESCASACE